MSERQDPYNTKLNPATEPTDARPGSEEKIEIMKKRWKRGEQLFHDDDFSLRGNGDDGGHTLKWNFGDGIEVLESPE
jgi:hypothetical protein